MLGAFVLPWACVAVAVVCMVVGFVVGDHDNENDYVKRFRRRARYLRWLSMSCLGVMGAVVTAAVSLGREQQTAGLIAFGLVAAVLASVYRYIVRLAYFYDARADALDLLTGATVPAFRGGEPVQALDDYARLVAVLSPDGVEYSDASTTLKATADLLKPKKDG